MADTPTTPRRHSGRPEISPMTAKNKNYDSYFTHKKSRVYRNMDSGDVIGHTTFREELREPQHGMSVKVGYEEKRLKTDKLQKRFGYSLDSNSNKPKGIRTSLKPNEISMRTMTPDADQTILTPRSALKRVAQTRNNKEYFVYDPSEAHKYLVHKPMRKLDANKLVKSPGRVVDPVFPVASYNQCTTAARAPQLCSSPRLTKNNISSVSYNIIEHAF
jgi:hypothetical protein